MRQFTEAGRNSTFPSQESTNDISVNEAMIWTPEEELFVERPMWTPADTDSSSSGMSPALRSMALFAAAGSISVALLKSLKLSSEFESRAHSKLLVKALAQ